MTIGRKRGTLIPYGGDLLPVRKEVSAINRKEQVLARLIAADKQFVSGEALAQEIGISRNSICKIIHRLRDEGCTIEAVSNRGYRLISLTDRLREAEIRNALHTRSLGQNLLLYPQLSSTNLIARALAEEGAPAGTVVAAEMQTAGRGRLGRSFDSPVGSGLYMSVILRPENWRGDVGMITSCAAVAVACAIERHYPVPVQIKWVNDLYVHGKKVCGILTEASTALESGEIRSVILGIGVNTARRTFPPELHAVATSLEEAAGGLSVSRGLLMADILNELEPALIRMDTGAFLEESRRRSALLGRVVQVTENGKVYSALALYIDKNGYLTVRTPDGQYRTLRSGEVSVHL